MTYTDPTADPSLCKLLADHVSDYFEQSRKTRYGKVAEFVATPRAPLPERQERKAGEECNER